MKSNNKQGLFLILMLVMAVALMGCGEANSSSESADPVNETEANRTVTSLESGISSGNETEIKETISSAGIEVTTTAGTNTYTKDQFATKCQKDAELSQLFNIKNRTITAKSDSKVVIRGEIDSFNNTEDIKLQATAKEEIASKIKGTATENFWPQLKKKTMKSLNQQQNYNGHYFNLSYPYSWRSIARLDTAEGLEMFVAAPEARVGYINMYIDLSAFTMELSNANLDQFVSDIDLSFATDEQLKNYSSTISDYTLDGVYAQQLQYDYTQEYYPKLVEITVEKRNEHWQITNITITISEQTKTRDIKGQNIFAFANNGLYWLIYTGNRGVYDNYLEEGTEIIDSCVIN